MAWIPTIDPVSADDALRDLYERTRDPMTGALDNIMRVHSLHPGGLEAHYRLYRAVMTPSPSLRKAEREMIALVVSQVNECHY
jgi:alkylhydroperoxidase family enzyme